jgi:hypothetical protein
MSVAFHVVEVVTMWDRRIIGVPNRPGKKTIEIEIPDGGESWTAASVAPRRQADVGHPALTYVTVISAVEAAQINADFKRQAEETLRATLAEEGEGYIGQNIDEIAVETGAKVDELLEAIKQEGYFSSWVIIEECTID